MNKKILITLGISVFLFTACQSNNVIGKDKAKEIALEHAKLTADRVKFVDTDTDTDNGKTIYEVEFYTDDFTEYDYEIDAKTGEIISFDSDAEGFTPKNKPTAESQSEKSAVTEAEIKAKLIEKVPGSSEENIQEFHKEYDDGTEIYEGKIIFDNNEYEFEVNAKTGEIISWESESVFD